MAGGLLLWLTRLVAGGAGDVIFNVCLIAVTLGAALSVFRCQDELRALFGENSGRREKEFDLERDTNMRYWGSWRDRYEQDYDRQFNNDGRRRRYGRQREDPVLVFCALLLLLLTLMLLNSGRLLSIFPHAFPFMAGVLSGCVLNFWMDRSAFSGIDKQIADACASYQPQAPQN